MKRKASVMFLSAMLAMAAAPLAAQQQGEWAIGVGLGYLEPKSDNGTLAGGTASIDADTRPTFTVEYYIRDNLGIELLAATPFEHDISISGIGAAGSTKHLPPTLSLNYYIPTQGPVTPFIGAGINYTTFFEETSPLGTLEIDDSFGIALHAGLDYAVSDAGALRLDLRWFDIDADVSLNGANIGETNIDPFLVGVSYIHRF